MKKLLVLTAIMLTYDNLVPAQTSVGSQIKVAHDYMMLIMKGQQEKAWQLFDKKNEPDLTKEKFATAFTYIQNSLDPFDTFALLTAITRVVDKRNLNMYRFKAESKTSHILTDVFVDLTFIDTSKLIGGLRSFTKKRDSTSLTSTNKETPLEKEFTSVIDNKNYNVRGINIVHLGNNSGLLAIQIERTITPEEFRDQSWAKTEAVKFAKYLKSKGYVEKGKQKATELGLSFLEELGVSFIDPATGQGINVPIKAGEIK